MSGFSGFPGGGVGGSIGPGTINTIAKFVAPNNVGDSTLTDDGTTVTAQGGQIVINAIPLKIPLSVINGALTTVFKIEPNGVGTGVAFVANDPAGPNASMVFGPGSGVAPVINLGLIRYNELLNQLEFSNNGGPFGPLGGGGGGTPTWDAILDPVANESLNMKAFTSTWTWTQNTGAGIDMFKMRDFAANTGTGYVLNVSTVAGSAAKPFHVGAGAVDAITVINSGAVGIGTAAPGAFALDVNGNARIQGKLTVTGLIDPTAIQLTDPVGQNCYVSMTDGTNATPPIGTAALRYLPLPQPVLQCSINGNPFVTIASATGGAAATASLPLVLTSGNITLGTAAAPTTADANADVIWGSSAIGKKPLVLQALAGQTASIQEWQDSTGAVQSSISASGNVLLNTARQLDTSAAGGLKIANTNATSVGIGTAMGVLGTLQVFINQGGTAYAGSNAGIQYSSTTANRGSIRVNQFGNNAGVPGITGFKSRGTNVGDPASVLDGDVLWRATAIGVAGDNVSVPLAGFLSIVVPTGGSVPLQNWVATDFVLSLVPLAGPINSNREVFRVTSEAAAQFINGTTAPVSTAAHGAIRYNNGTPAFEVSLNGAAWTPLLTGSFAGSISANAITYGIPGGGGLTSDAALTAFPADPFGRPQIHDMRLGGGGQGCMWRQGSWEADGDPTSVICTGNVQYGSNAPDLGPDMNQGGYYLGGPHGFGIYEIVVGVNGGNTFLECGFEDGGPQAPYGYNGFFVYSNTYTSQFAVLRSSGYVGVGADTAIGAEHFRVTDGTSILDFTSTTALQVTQTGGGNPALVVDTTNTRVGIGGAPATYTLEVSGSVSVIGSNTTTFLNMGDGSACAVSGAAQGRIRYNGGTNKFEFSENGSAYLNCFPTGGAVGGSGTTGKLPKWSASQTLTDSITTETAGSLTDATTYGNFVVGAVDAFGRPQVWWSAINGANAGLLRLGSNVSDGDGSNIDSDGIAIWRPSDNTAARIKTDRFGLTQSTASANYYFRVDGSKLFYCLTPGGTDYRIYIDKATGFVGFGGISTPLAAEAFRVVGVSQFDTSIQIGKPSVAQGSLILANTSANSVTLKSSNTTAAPWTMELPINPGTNGQVLTTDGTGITAWSTVASGSATWDAILDPIGNQSLSMANKTTLWRWNDLTANDLFTMTDTAANTGTGYLFNAVTAATSTRKPFHVGTATVDAITVLASGAVGIATNAPGAFALDVAGKLNVQNDLSVIGNSSNLTVNGASLNIKSISELISATGAAFNDSVANLLPANVLIVCVAFRCTVTADNGTTSFNVGTATDANVFGDTIASTAGTVSSSFKLLVPLNPSMQDIADKIRISWTGGPPSTGSVRVTVYYIDCNEPAS